MTSGDTRCPYCNEWQEVFRNDRLGYGEDRKHETQCEYCEKHYVFRMAISFDYTASKADCLNDGEHKLACTDTSPRRFTRMACTDCDYTRTPTLEEMAIIHADDKRAFDENN